MKLQYYLRGLGIGILVTAIIFCVLPGEKETLSDAEIRARALKLGMVESSSLTLADVQNKQQAEASQKETENQKKENNDSQDAAKQEAAATQPSGNGQESTTGQPDSNGQESQQQATTENQDVDNVSTGNSDTGNTNTGNTGSQSTENTGAADIHQQETVKAEQEADSEIIKITVESGAHSYTVANKLEEMQLVENAREFDEYLCSNGYSRYIRVGTHKIPKGSTWEEIAQIISGK